MRDILSTQKEIAAIITVLCIKIISDNNADNMHSLIWNAINDITDLCLANEEMLSANIYDKIRSIENSEQIEYEVEEILEILRKLLPS